MNSDALEPITCAVKDCTYGDDGACTNAERILDHWPKKLWNPERPSRCTVENWSRTFCHPDSVARGWETLETVLDEGRKWFIVLASMDLKDPKKYDFEEEIL